MNKYPEIPFGEPDPLGEYYINDKGEAFAVARLVEEARRLEPFDLPLAGLYLGDKIWQDSDIHKLAWHIRRVRDADLKTPIILDCEGAIADGRHRVLKALVLGKTTIPAVRIWWELKPDYIEKE